MNILNAVSESWWSLVFHASWQSAMVAAVLLGVVWGMRRLPAPLRYGLLVVALVKFAVPPVIGVPVSVPHWIASEPAGLLASASPVAAPAAAPVARVGADVVVVQPAASSSPEPSMPQREYAEASAPVAGGHRVAAAQLQRPLDREGGSTPAVAAPQGAVIPRDVPALSWRAWLLLVHGAGAGVVLCLLAHSFLRLRRMTRSCRLVKAGPLREPFDRLRTRLGVQGAVELLVAPGDASPMALGILRRRVLMPEVLVDTLSGGQIDSILAHELAHHRRKDTWFIMAENLLLVFWWFHPVFWLVLRSLRSAREDCCDDRLLESGISDDESYCESLLRAAATVRRPGLGRAALGFADQFHPLGRRLRRIMDMSIERRAGLSAAWMGCLVLLALCVAPGIRMVDAEDAAPATPAEQVAPVLSAGKLNEGLAAWYPFDGDAKDLSGNGNEGTVLGATLTADRNGKPNSAYHFNGKNQSIVVPDNKSINIYGKTSLTIGAWIHPEDVSSPKSIVWKWGPAYREDDQYRLGLEGGRTLFGLSRLTESVTGTAVPVKEWSSLTGVYDAEAKRLKLYMNGRLVQEKPCIGELYAADIPLYIGAGDSPQQYSAGDIDEVRIYARALSVDEITAVYGPGAADQPAGPQKAAVETPQASGSAGTDTAVTVMFDGRYRHGERGEDHQVVKQREDGSFVAVAELGFMRSKEIVAGARDRGLSYYEIDGGKYEIIMEFEPGKVFVTRNGVREDWVRKEFTVPEDAFFDPNSRPDSYCAAQVYARILPAISQGATQEFDVYDWDNTGNAFGFYKISLTNAGSDTIDVPAGKFEATHIVLRQLSSGGTWFKKREGHLTDFWLLSDGSIARILRGREPYELQLQSAATPPELPDRLGPPSEVQATPATPAPPTGPAPEIIKQALAAPAPAAFEQAPGNVTLDALYRHKSRGQAIDVPEHRWIKTQPDGTSVVTVCELPFMKSIYLAAGGPQQGFTRYEAHAEAEGGGPGYQLVMEFEPGKVVVSRKGVREDWNRKEFVVPLGAVFDPNSRPDPYCATQVLERVITIPGGGSIEFDAYDWDNTGDAFAFYKMKIANAGYEEVTVPCGRFNATHVVIEQLTSADTWYKKRAGHITDMWVLTDGTIIRILRHREPYEIELLEWKTPETLPGLIERIAPQAPNTPGPAPRVPIAESDRIRGCWSARGFAVPYDAVMYMTPVAGEAGGATQLGVGASMKENRLLFGSLPNDPQPPGEVKVGEYKKGEVVPFCMVTSFGEDFFVSTSEDTEAARVAFQDIDRSLGLDDGSILEQIAPDKWLLRLDDANSYKYDDDDNDIPIIIRLEKR